jgi:hypothetical protein
LHSRIEEEGEIWRPNGLSWDRIFYIRGIPLCRHLIVLDLELGLEAHENNETDPQNSDEPKSASPTEPDDCISGSEEEFEGEDEFEFDLS